MSDIDTFLVQFPEFVGVPTGSIGAMLDAAALETDSAVWGAKYDQGRYYLTAHKLASSPYGQNARLAAKDGTTTYERHLDTLKSQVTIGFARVV